MESIKVNSDLKKKNILQLELKETQSALVGKCSPVLSDLHISLQIYGNTFSDYYLTQYVFKWKQNLTLKD